MLNGRRWLSALGCAAGLASAPGVQASAGPAVSGLSSTERSALSAGERIERPMRFYSRQRAYVGGIAYQLVEARPEDVLAALQDVERLPELLPRVRSARLLEADSERVRIELTQGTSAFAVTYGLSMYRVPGRRELRFWLDPRVRRDIRDVWGYFRADPRPGGRTLVTVAIALDLGPGLMRALFEDRIQAVMLRSVTRIRDAMQPRRMAGAGAPK